MEQSIDNNPQNDEKIIILKSEGNDIENRNNSPSQLNPIQKQVAQNPYSDVTVTVVRRSREDKTMSSVQMQELIEPNDGNNSVQSIRISDIQNVCASQQHLKDKETDEISKAPPSVLNESIGQSVYPKRAKIHPELFQEGGSKDQSVVEGTQKLNLGSLNNSSQSESFSSSQSSDKDLSNRSGEEACTPKKQKVSKSAFEKQSLFNNTAYQGMQIAMGPVYFINCLIGVLAHLSNYQKILDSEDSIVAKPSSTKDLTEFASNDKIIKTIDIIEFILLVIIVIDLIIKIVNHLKVVKSNIHLLTTEKQCEQIYFDEPLTFDPFKTNGGHFVIKTLYVVMDAVLVFALVAMYLIQMGLAQSGNLNYMHIGMLMMVRAYFKIPFAVAVILFIAKVREIRHSQNLIFPKKQSEDFKTYKEKVLFIINSIRKQFGKRIYNSQPNFDLAWCSFIIENDYLQISNSISGTCNEKLLNYSQQNTQDIDTSKTKKNRRFSKTIQTHFGHRNKTFVENLIMNEQFKVSQECANGTCGRPELENFNEYFNGFQYDAYSIDNATEGNLLYFTLVYSFNRQQWGEKIQCVNIDKYKRLAYRLQMAYRQNFYHSQVHAADVVQNLVYFFNSCGVYELCQMTDNDMFFSLLSGAAHDIDHPGTNNAFEVKCRSKLAILYNDQSVLEQHHAASFFFLLDNINYDCNIMEGFSDQERLYGRKMILENILGTDMTKHNAILADVKAIAELPEAERQMGDKNKAYLLKALVHAADIGNPTRPFEIAKKWGINIVKEFFHQGDREKALGLEISFGCDRSNSNFAKSQIGFLDFMIYPYFNTLAVIIPKMDILSSQIKINVGEYKKLVDQYEQVMKDGNSDF